MHPTLRTAAEQDADRIVRHPDGSIDLDHYLELGRTHRAKQARRIASGLCGWSWRQPFSRRTLPAR